MISGPLTVLVAEFTRLGLANFTRRWSGEFHPTPTDVIALLLQSQKQNALFMEQISVMQAQRFGRKTEKLETLVGQLGMFNEAEAEADKEPETEEEEPEREEITYTRNKKKPGTLDEMLKGLPVREEKHELTEEELTEIFGENGWKQLPDEIYRKLEYHPATKEVGQSLFVWDASKRYDQDN